MAFADLFANLFPALGAPMLAEHRRRYERSDQWNGGVFRNAVPTVLDVGPRDTFWFMRELMRRNTMRRPSAPLPSVPYRAPLTPEPQVRWFGHSAVLFEEAGRTVLFDPMFGRSPAPFPFVGPQRYPTQVPLDPLTLPDIDVAVLSHDHYDHLDHGTIALLRPKVRQWVVTLGVARHLVAWGVDADAIVELDWHESVNAIGMTFTCLPARHFSGRGLWDRFGSLWASWSVVTPSTRLYFSADSGYGDHFAEIGERYGPFDMVLMECGQYHPKWKAIHMLPEESVLAARDVRAAVAVPIHWAAFTLALHPWFEPAERFTAAAHDAGLLIATPMLGEVVPVFGPHPREQWWRELVPGTL